MKYLLLIISLNIFLAGCGSSSDGTQPPENELGMTEDAATADESGANSSMEPMNTETMQTIQESSSCGFIPVPIAKEFYGDNTVLVEIFIYEKAVNSDGALVDRIQFDRNIDNANIEFFLLDFNRSANVPLGLLAPNGCDSLGEFRQCHSELEPQDFNVIAVSTSDNGDTVSIVNNDFCGTSPNFKFDDIDGEIPVNSLASLLSELGYPDFQNLLIQ